MKLETIFMMEDLMLKQVGLYAMWTSIYIANLVVLSIDNTKDNSRDFNIIANGLSVIYGGISSANLIYGNGLPSTMLLVAGPIHQYMFWLLFVYFGGREVLGRHPIGVFNWFTVFLVGMFTLDMIMKTWLVAINPESYHKYVNRKKNITLNVHDFDSDSVKSEITSSDV